MSINIAILHRLERAERVEASSARGLADEIVSCEQTRSRLASVLHSVRTSAAHWPRRQPEPGLSAEGQAELENMRISARLETLREVRKLMHQTNTDVGQFMGVLQQASEPSEADFAIAIDQAEAALAACEVELVTLGHERSRRGRRLGELRAAIKAGHDWLRAHGHVAETVYADAR